MTGAVLAAMTMAGALWNTVPASASPAAHASKVTLRVHTAGKQPETARRAPAATVPDRPTRARQPHQAAATDIRDVCTHEETTGTTITLTAGCDTTVTLMVPDGFTLNGQGNTITAHDPTAGPFTGPVLANEGQSMFLENLTVRGIGFAEVCGTGLAGVEFINASGSVTDVHVLDITEHAGCPLGQAIWIEATANGHQTVTITDSTASGFERAGLLVRGDASVNVSGSTFGPPDVSPDRPAQNAVQIGSPSNNAGVTTGGTFTDNTVIGTGLWRTDESSTAMLLYNAAHLTISDNTFTGAGTDVGIILTASTDITISHNDITRTAGSEDMPDASGHGVEATDQVSSTGTTLICNTFSGWKTNLVDVTQPPCITTRELPEGTVGKQYSATLEATTPNPPLTWSLAEGSSLPPGLTLNEDGTITGTPATTGTFTFTLVATDANGVSSSHDFTITIPAAPPPKPPFPPRPPVKPTVPKVPVTKVPVTG